MPSAGCPSDMASVIVGYTHRKSRRRVPPLAAPVSVLASILADGAGLVSLRSLAVLAAVASGLGQEHAINRSLALPNVLRVAEAGD